MLAAVVLLVGSLLTAGVVLAGAPFLSERLGADPVVAAKISLSGGITIAGLTIAMAIATTRFEMSGAPALALSGLGVMAVAAVWIKG